MYCLLNLNLISFVVWLNYRKITILLVVCAIIVCFIITFVVPFDIYTTKKITLKERTEFMETSKQVLEKKLIGLHDNMLNFAQKLTSNKSDADDLTQEATLRVLANLDKYYDNVNFKGWVFTIMHNIFVNNYRRMVRSQTVIDQTDNSYFLNIPQDSGFNSPEGSYSLHELNKVIDTFDEDYKLPFKLHVSGYKYEEIAQRLNLPIGTVKSRIFFIRKRLQEVLKNYRS